MRLPVENGLFSSVVRSPCKKSFNTEAIMPPDDTPSKHKAIGTLLLERKLITPADIAKALAFQQQFKSRFGSILVRIGAISEDALLPVLAEQIRLPLLLDENLPTQGESILGAIQKSGLSPHWFQDQRVVAWESADGDIYCASRNPAETALQESLSFAFASYRTHWFLARTQSVEDLLKLFQQPDKAEPQDEIAHLRELAEEAPVIELVTNILSQAIDEGASDIHLEPAEHIFSVRYRLDGLLQSSMSLPRSRFDAVTSRIKLISGMDIAERRLPQDGRISTRASGIEMDIRVSCVPCVHGESIVMRLLPKERASLNLEKLGLEPDHLAQFTRWIKEPHGIILVTGPTGSGKSTTLYAGLEITNDGKHKVITVEDPVEFKMNGVIQIQTQSEIGYTFARALRAILRQDPDIIMIGEIRDLETAEIAVQSALTGHMVLSTLHTNDALSAFTRLLDMGIEPFLVTSSVRAVQAQRLVRKLCEKCSVRHTPVPAIVDVLRSLQDRFPGLFKGTPDWRTFTGCKHCQGTGYRGRQGIYEFLELTPPLQEAIMRRDPAKKMLDIANAQGYRTLREDGLIKAWRGLTSIEEVLRVTGISTGEA